MALSITRPTGVQVEMQEDPAMAGEVAGDQAPQTVTPEMLERLGQYDKMVKDNASMGFRLRAHEKVVKELGTVIQYDGSGNPIGINADEEPAPVPVAAAPVGAHPFAPLAVGVEGWDPKSADAYYQAQTEALMAKQGFVTTTQAQQMAVHTAQTVNANNAVWRMYDRLVARDVYGSLSDTASPLYVRTAQVLQDRNLGSPLTHDPVTGQPLTGEVPFDRWSYRDLESLQLGADLAAMAIEKETKAAVVSTGAAEGAQAGAQLGDGPAAGGDGAPTGRPDLASMKTPEEIITALDQAENAGAGAPGGTK